MKTVRQYTSHGEYVKVVQTDGKIWDNVIICPDPLDPYSRKHILEASNGDTVYIYTGDIRAIYYGKDEESVVTAARSWANAQVKQLEWNLKNGSKFEQIQAKVKLKKINALTEKEFDDYMVASYQMYLESE